MYEKYFYNIDEYPYLKSDHSHSPAILRLFKVTVFNSKSFLFYDITRSSSLLKKHIYRYIDRKPLLFFINSCFFFFNLAILIK